MSSSLHHVEDHAIQLFSALGSLQTIEVHEPLDSTIYNATLGQLFLKDQPTTAFLRALTRAPEDDSGPSLVCSGLTELRITFSEPVTLYDFLWDALRAMVESRLSFRRSSDRAHLTYGALNTKNELFSGVISGIR